MSITYLKAGEYLVPNVAIPNSAPLGKYGRMRRKFLQESRPNLYTELMITGELMNSLHMTEQETIKQLEKTKADLLLKDPAPEKAKGSLAWTQHMEQIRIQAEELVLPETVYA